MDFEFKRLLDTNYKSVVHNENARYCEFSAKRDRSSLAGIAYEVIGENELFFSDIDEHLFLEINEHENIYTGLDDDYCDSLKEIYARFGCQTGIKILFLVYSDVKSSQMAFESLFTELLNRLK